MALTEKQMVEQMYKILVTGNGEKAIPEKVRDNEENLSALKENHEKLYEENKISHKEIYNKFNDHGKWIYRIAGAILAAGQLFLAYMVFVEKILKK